MSDKEADLRSYEDLDVTLNGGAMRITIDRPQQSNSLRPQTVTELIDAFGAAERNSLVRVVVLTGAGDRAFCAGSDFSDIAREDVGGAAVDAARQLLQLSLVMRGCGKPIIARIRGWSVAAGNELQVLCDLAIASDDSQFRQGGPDVGSVPAWWGCQLLPLVMGDRRAREAIFLARTYTAEEAREAGLVNAVVSASQLDAVVDEWCDRISAMSESALRFSKSLLNANSALFVGALLQGYDRLPEFHNSEEALKRLGGVAQGTSPPRWTPTR